MEEKKPTDTAPAQFKPVTPPPVFTKSDKPAKTKSVSKVAVVACILAVVAVAASGFVYTKSAGDTKKSKDKQAADVKTLEEKITKLEAEANYEQLAVDKDRFQAVFLVSGSVYFGKITDVKKDVIKLENIYYLRNGQYDKSGNITGGADVSLAKLGKELHGPDDVMYIERKNLEFWENLKNDGEVVRAIIDYEKKN